jgi:hypothetical protein
MGRLSVSWQGRPKTGTYCPERTTSIHDGIMDIWLHSEVVDGTMKNLVDAPLPVISGRSYGNSQRYGRYVIRYKVPAPFPDFHLSWLLWPNSNQRADGEIDFPEVDTNSRKIGAFMHWHKGPSSSQYAYIVDTPFYGSWHTAVIEWLPSRVTFLIDGKKVGNTANPSKIPNKPLHWIIQNNLSFFGRHHASSRGHIYIDWVAIYARAGG